MFCQKCGTENKDDVKFCSKCGNDLKSVKVETERKGLTGKLGKMGIPGFRSGESWKMVLATLAYFFIGIPIIIIFLAIISAFVFGIGGTQTSAPTLSIVASNHPDTSGADIKIQHKGGDGLNGGEWKLSIVEVGQPALFKTSNVGNDLNVGKQIIATTTTCSDGVVTDQIVTGCTTLVLNKNYNVKLVHIPSNALLVDQIVEVKSTNSPSSDVTQSKTINTPTPTSQKGTYNNPASVGEIIVIKSSGKTFDVSVTEVVRGQVINDAIATENMYNDEPLSGYDYAAVKVQIKYSAGEGSESYLGTPFSAFSEGIELDDPTVITPKKYPEFSTDEFMPGATKTGWVFFTVPQNKQVLIRFKPNPFIDKACYINIGQ